MKIIAPDIKRQRLLIEGYYEIDADEQGIRDYFDKITKELNLRMYGAPIIFCPGGEGKEENQGYDAFVPLIDSGISVYVWTNAKFVSLIIYTCKDFDENMALESTKSFFKITELHFKSF